MRQATFLTDLDAAFRPFLTRGEHGWDFRFRHADFEYRLTIKHRYAVPNDECVTELFTVRQDGENDAVAMVAEDFQRLKHLTRGREHLTEDMVFIIPQELAHGVIKRVNWCLDRWNAIQTLVRLEDTF